MPSRAAIHVVTPVVAPVVIFVGAIAAFAGASACGEAVSCENLCQHTLACEVTFRPSDDLDGHRIDNGERTDAEDCAKGCEENPAVTVESAKCVDDVTAQSTDPTVCQEQVLDCFGADAPSAT